MDWINSAQDRDRWRALLNVARNLQVPYNVGNFFTSSKPVSFTRRTLLHGVSECVIKQVIIDTLDNNINVHRLHTSFCNKYAVKSMKFNPLKLSGQYRERQV